MANTYKDQRKSKKQNKTKQPLGGNWSGPDGKTCSLNSSNNSTDEESLVDSGKIMKDMLTGPAGGLDIRQGRA